MSHGLDDSQKLDKTIGLFDIYAVSMGGMLSSGFFLLPGLATAKSGPSVILAYLLAGVLLVPATLSMAELATAMPRSGGTYFFIDRSLGPLAGTIGGVGTWLSMILKSAFALIGMGAYLALVFELPIVPVALTLTALFAVLNIVGVEQTLGLLVGLVVGVLAVMVLFLGEGFTELARLTAADLGDRFEPFFSHGFAGLFATIGFIAVSYAGLIKVVSVAEEVRDPERNIPLGMILSLLTAMALYGLGIALMIAFVEPTALHDDLTPVATAADVFMSWLPGRWGTWLIIAAAVAGFAAAGNAALLSASRYPLALARDGLAPRVFARVSERLGTPVPAVLVTAVLMATFIVALSEEGVAKLASSVLLLVVGLCCLAVVVMREARIDSYDPGFPSPLYPWTQLAGVAVSCWLIVEIGVMSMLFAAGIVTLSVVWFVVYGRHRVRRAGALLHVFERLGRRRFDALDQELRGMMKEKGLRHADPFDEVVARAFAFEAEAADFETVARRASELLAERVPATPDELLAGFLEGTRGGATPVSHGAALPHTRLAGAERPELVLVRSRSGFCLTAAERPPGHADSDPIHALFFLVSPERDPAQHLRILAQIAGRVDDERFLDEWLGAEHEAALKEVLLRDERFVLVRLSDDDSPAADWVGRRIGQLELPGECLVALVRRRGGDTIIPHGDTVLRSDDRVTIIGTPNGIAAVHRRLAP